MDRQDAGTTKHGSREPGRNVPTNATSGQAGRGMLGTSPSEWIAPPSGGANVNRHAHAHRSRCYSQTARAARYRLAREERLTSRKRNAFGHVALSRPVG